MAKDFTAKLLEARANVKTCDNLDCKPLFVPTGFQVPETSQQTMARLMLNSGMISLDDYHNMIGVTFDGDYSTDTERFSDFEDWEDDFKQSQFAEYEHHSEHDHASGLAPSGSHSEALSAGSTIRAEEGPSGSGDKGQAPSLDGEANKQSDTIQPSGEGNQ